MFFPLDYRFSATRYGVAQIFLYLGVAISCASVAFPQEAREWRNAEGRPLYVKLVGTLELEDDADSESVRIRVGSRVYRYPLTKLSEADREYVKSERAKKRDEAIVIDPDLTLENSSDVVAHSDLGNNDNRNADAWKALTVVAHSDLGNNDNESNNAKPESNVRAAARHSETSIPISASDFGTPTRTVSTVAELVAAVKDAQKGDVIALADGTYNLDDSIDFENKSLTLVGSSGKRDAVRIVATKANSLWAFCLDGDVELTLVDLTLESQDNCALTVSKDDSASCALTALRCAFIGADGCALYLYGTRCSFTECLISSEDGSLSLGSEGNGSLEAQNCEFLGKISFSDTSVLSTLRNCKIEGKGNSQAIQLYKPDDAVGAPRCEIIDCEIYGDEGGVTCSGGAQATIRGGEIRDCGGKFDYAVYVWDNSAVTLENMKISNCYYAVGISSGSQCKATNLTFTGVKDKWDIADAAGSVTYNGQRMTDDD